MLNILKNCNINNSSQKSSLVENINYYLDNSEKHIKLVSDLDEFKKYSQNVQCFLRGLYAIKKSLCNEIKSSINSDTSIKTKTFDVQKAFLTMNKIQDFCKNYKALLINALNLMKKVNEQLKEKLVTSAVNTWFGENYLMCLNLKSFCKDLTENVKVDAVLNDIENLCDNSKYIIDDLKKEFIKVIEDHQSL